MAQTTTAAIIAASRDSDLRERLIATAARAGVDSPQAWVESRLHELASTDATSSGDTIASVYDYARATYTPAPRPGENPAAVTDTHLEYAVQKLLNPTA